MSISIEPSSAVNYQLPLLSIPLEVLLQIIRGLTTVEYGNVRLTCKRVEATLFNSFAREFFSKKQFMITEFSLQALLDISKSRLSPYLKNVVFGLERPANTSFYVSSKDPAETELKHNILAKEYIGYMNLIGTGQDVEMLSQAFSSLSNLRTIDIRDFNSYSRRRDYPNMAWRSYGSVTFERETGTRLEKPRNIYDMASSLQQMDHTDRIFLSLLRALGKSQARPEQFECILRHIPLRDHAFSLPKYVLPLVEPVLANIRTLFLDVKTGNSDVRYNIEYTSVISRNYRLKEFLSKCVLLEHLRLNFHDNIFSWPGQEQYETRDVLDWLSEPEDTAGLSLPPPDSPLRPRPVQFPHLKQLDIGMVVAESKTLVSLIDKYQQSLRGFSFHKVSLVETEKDKSRDKPNLWAGFFRQLQKLNLFLYTISITEMHQMSHEGRSPTVSFKDSNISNGKKWAGNDTESGLRDFAALVQVHIPEPEPRTSIDDDDSGSGDSDDSDEYMQDADSPDDAGASD